MLKQITGENVLRFLHYDPYNDKGKNDRAYNGDAFPV